MFQINTDNLDNNTFNKRTNVGKHTPYLFREIGE